MTVIGRLRQRVLQTRLHPFGAVVRDPDRLRDRVRGLEADAPDVRRQLVRTVLDHRDRRVTVLLVDPHRDRRGDADPLEEQHHLLDRLLLGPRGGDLRGAFRAEAGDLDQPARRLLDDLQRLQAEVVHDPLGEDRPDALDQAGSQVSADALHGRRQHRGVRDDLELPAVLRMRAPPAGQPQALPGLRAEQRADHGEQVVAAPRGGHPGDGVARLLVHIGQPLQHRFQDVRRRAGGLGRAGHGDHRARRGGFRKLLPLPCRVWRFLISPFRNCARTDRPPPSRPASVTSGRAPSTRRAPPPNPSSWSRPRPRYAASPATT